MIDSKVRSRLSDFTVAFAVILLYGCGVDDDATNTENSNSPIGNWEIRYQDAVGQSYLNVLELRPDGTYTTHMQDATPGDFGRFSLSETAISLASHVDPRFSRDIPYQMKGDETLELTIAGSEPGGTPVYASWTRSSLSHAIRTINMSDRRVPGDLPRKLTEIALQARDWKQDAVPTWIRIEALENGGFETVLHFFSAANEEEMRVRLSAFDTRVTLHDGGRTAKTALPTDFLDLPLILKRLIDAGKTSALDSANLRVFSNHGAVWRVGMTDGQQLSFSAATGDAIEDDVTGYIDQYEADWNHAGELWRKAMERYSPQDKYESCRDENHWYGCAINAAGCQWIEPSETIPDGSCSPVLGYTNFPN